MEQGQEGKLSRHLFLLGGYDSYNFLVTGRDVISLLTLKGIKGFVFKKRKWNK